VEPRECLDTVDAIESIKYSRKKKDEGKKKTQSKTKTRKLKIEAFNLGHRVVSDKAQKNASQVKEPLLKRDMRPVNTSV